METQPAFNPEAFAPAATSEAAFRKQYELQPGDEGLDVEFYKKPVVMTFRTKQAREGDPAKNIPANPAADDIIEYQDFLRINVPGNDKMQFDGPVNDLHKRRFAEKWAAYQSGQKADSGTPLDTLPGLMPEQIALFKTKHVHNLEALAGISDTHGPNLGLGWRLLRKAAQDRLTGAGKNDVADLKKLVEAQAAEIEKLKKPKGP